MGDRQTVHWLCVEEHLVDTMEKDCKKDWDQRQKCNSTEAKEPERVNSSPAREPKIKSPQMRRLQLGEIVDRRDCWHREDYGT